METDLDLLREALEASWDRNTSYQMVFEENNPALGQCYSTSRVIQILFPEAEIVEGEVWTGNHIEKHFWNLLPADGVARHVDLTWQQFPANSEIRNWRVRARESLGDRPETIRRVNLLLERVNDHVSRQQHEARATESKDLPTKTPSLNERKQL